MPNALQVFLAASTRKASVDLVDALLRLPKDKWNWSPSDTARTALDQVAECAINNAYTADLIETKQWVMNDYDAYLKEKADLAAGDWDALYVLLQKNTERVIAVISAVPEENFKDEVVMPWATQTVGDTIVYPYWNMTYHQGQINYIASILSSQY